MVELRSPEGGRPGTDADVTAALLAIADRQPGAVFLSAPSRPPMRWAALAERIHAVGREFAGWDLGRGDIVAAPAFDRLACAAALAVLPAASTFALLSDGLAPGGYADLLRRLRARAVLVPRRPDRAPHGLALAARDLRIARIHAETRSDGETGAFDLALDSPDASLDAPHTGDSRHGWIGVTSGTTGRPKLVPHGHRQVLETAAATGARLAMSPADASAHLTPLTLANGQRTAFLLSLLNGGSVHCLPEADVLALLDAIDAGEVSYVSCSFTIHRELLERFRGGRRPPRSSRLRFVRVASGRLDDDEMDALEAAFGVPVVTGLGSTETGMVAHQELSPARRQRGSVGKPLASEIRLVDDSGHPVPPGSIGAIEVRGPQLFDGYLDDPDLTARSFVDGWFRMGDLGRFDEHGELRVVGRVAEIINRGGEKIAPLEIDAVLRSLTGVADAAAFGLPHPRLGEVVAAAVVRAPDVSLSERTVREFVRQRLGARRSPLRVWFVDKLPRNPAGKLERARLSTSVGQTLAEPLSGGPGPASEESTTAMSPMEATLAGIWRRALGVTAISRDRRFSELGGDMTRADALVQDLRAALGIEIDAEAILHDDPTVSGMARTLRGE